MAVNDGRRLLAELLDICRWFEKMQGAIAVYGEGGLLELMRRGVGDKQLLEDATNQSTY